MEVSAANTGPVSASPSIGESVRIIFCAVSCRVSIKLEPASVQPQYRVPTPFISLFISIHVARCRFVPAESEPEDEFDPMSPVNAVQESRESRLSSDQSSSSVPPVTLVQPVRPPRFEIEVEVESASSQAPASMSQEPAINPAVPRPRFQIEVEVESNSKSSKTPQPPAGQRPEAPSKPERPLPLDRWGNVVDDEEQASTPRLSAREAKQHAKVATGLLTDSSSASDSELPVFTVEV